MEGTKTPEGQTWWGRSDATPLGAPAAVVRQGSHVANQGDLQAGHLQGANRGFATRTRPANQHLDLTHALLKGAARCRFGRYLRVRVAERAPDVAALLREFPAQREQGEDGEILREQPLRFEVLREGARCEVQLGEQALIFPGDAALAACMAQAHERAAEIAYD